MRSSRLTIGLLLASAVGFGVLAPAPAPNPDLPDAHAVLTYLNQSIDWQRRVAIEEENTSEPEEMLFLADEKQTSIQVLRLSFEFARVAAQALGGRNAAPSDADTSPSTRYGSLMSAADKAEQEAKQTQAELESDRDKLDSLQGAKRRQMQATIDELQSELDLANARSQALRDLSQFAGTAGSGGSGLAAQIDELQRAVPELQADTGKQPASAAGAVASSAPKPAPAPTGALSLIDGLLNLRHKEKILEQSLEATTSLADTISKMRSPLVARLRALAQRGEDLAKAADTASPAELEQEKHDLDALTADFKRYTALAVPLQKQTVLLRLSKNNLQRWHDVVKAQYSTELRDLLVRVILFGAVIVIALVFSEVWRKAIFRYVHDARRRYQFLLLRRIVLWCVIGVTVAFALASEIGSLATFAGLITAGVAVALQNVILAVAGYFFLIGKYGVRVGDRVQIAGITGDVVDVGLVRLHLMELGGSDNGRQATGRVVVFSNSIVFQPGVSFFKQIPGTSFVWHDLSLTLTPGTDYNVAEKRIMAAVERVYGQYKEKIEKQHHHIQQTLDLPVSAPRPASRLRMTQHGLELVVRYPVEVEDAARTDDAVTRELLTELAKSPQIKLAGSGAPEIQPEPDAAASTRK